MKSLYYVIIVFSFFSCKYNQKPDTTNNNSALDLIEKIEVPVFDNEFSLKSQSEIVDYIILETTSDNIIGEVNRLILFGEFVILLDVANNKQLLFKNDGSYVDKICSEGKGPGETLAAKDILISESDSIIEILDVQKLIKKDFSLQTISEHSIPFFTSYFLKSNSGDYWFFMNNQLNNINKSDISPNLISTSNDLEILDYRLSIEIKDLILRGSTPFTRSENNAVFSLPFDNSIYCIRDNNVLKYEVCFGKHNVPDKIIQSAKNAPDGFERHMRYKEVFDNVNNLGSAWHIQAPLENENYLYFQFTKKRKAYGVLYNKKTKSIESGLLPANFGQPMVLDNKNQLISVLYPHNFNNADKENSLLKSKIEDSNKSFTELGNPIIEIIQLK